VSGTAASFPKAVRAALNDGRLQSALQHLKEGFQVKRAKAFAALPDAEGLREQGRAIRESALSRLDALLLQFEDRVQSRGGRVHWARDAAEARAIVTAILKERGAKLVTKGKSMVTEEIELNPYLIENGITPVETDLGEYIIQLRDERPSHIVAPAFHLRRDDVEKSFREAHSALPTERKLDDRPALVAEARAVLRRNFEAADAGITGANILIAETGTAMIVTNEGNGDLTRLLPKTHIVVTTIDRIVPTLNDAAILLRLLTRSATGQEITSYVSLMSGPKRDSDADGPESFHVVLLDNGRGAILGSPVREVLHCIRCGACMNHCPVYSAIGGHAYGAVYPGPLGAALDPGLYGLAAMADIPNASSFCGRCEAVCPVKIPLTRLMRHWRTVAFARGISTGGFTAGLKLWAAFAKRPALYRMAAAIAARALRAAGRNGRVRKFPLLSGWFFARDLARPAPASFQTLWHRRRRS
jgi:L-lactate dehydrogenase complex protein LldF